MTVVIWGIFLLVAIVLQATIVPLLAINGHKPDLLLAVVVSTGLLLGKEKGVGMGFFSGLLQDLASGNIFGVNILSKLATGYLFGMAEQKVFKEHILLPLLSMAMATVFNNLVMLIVLFMLGYKVDFFAAVFYNTLPLLGYNLLVAIPVHQVVYRVLASKREMRF